MTEDILKLKGKDAKAFLKYDSTELTPERKVFLEDTRKYYKAHCKQ
ncbi:MAG: hypothetical protein ACRDFB_02765 [Rhabdochlamydiaceae bacterium]